MESVENKCLEYQEERDQAAETAEVAQTKLRERNQAIDQIESEVKNVHAKFQQKYQKLATAKDAQLEALEKQHQNEKQETIFYKREKDALLTRMEQMEQIESGLKRQIGTLERELQIVIGEMDRQKRSSEEKMKRLQLAILS